MLSLASASLSYTGAMPAMPVVQRAAAPAMGLSWTTPGEGAVFDPLGITKDAAKFEKFRYAEVKHGRVAMLAVVGHITAASGARFGGELADGVKFTEIQGSGYKALSQLGSTDLWIILLSVGFLEMRIMKEVPGAPKPEHPGDLRNGLFKEQWDKYTPAEKKSKISKELNNGRAAMMGILGLMTHEAINGQPYVINDMLGWGQPY